VPNILTLHGRAVLGKLPSSQVTGCPCLMVQCLNALHVATQFISLRITFSIDWHKHVKTLHTFIVPDGSQKLLDALLSTFMQILGKASLQI